MKTVLLVLGALSLSLVKGARNYCLPCQSCWPSDADVLQLNQSLTGEIIPPTDEVKFEQAANIYNYRLYRSPGFVVDPRSTGDVKKAIKFAQDHNMLMSIKSSGHDFVGRNTAYGSLHLTMRNFRNIEVNMSDPTSDTGASATIQSGAVWYEVYEKLDQYGRMIVGGASPGVAIGGYTCGGGHGATSRVHGMAVDNVISFQIVLADQTLRNCTAEGCVIINDDGTVTPVADSADLFWAVRGGGGVFGVVISFTFKIHVPPPQFVHLIIKWPITHRDYGKVGWRVLNFYNNFVQAMPHEWGGYIISNNYESTNVSEGAILISLLHNGPWEQGIPHILPLFNVEKETQQISVFVNHSTYFEYARTINDYNPARIHLTGRVIQAPDLTHEIFTPLMTDTMMNLTAEMACFGIHIGGKVSEAALSSAPISEGFRSGIITMACASSWSNEYLDDTVNADIIRFTNHLYTMGKNTYYNEPYLEVADWKNEFWFPHYDKLLSIKLKYDPQNFFTCKKCVGWDLAANTIKYGPSKENSSSKPYFY